MESFFTSFGPTEPWTLWQSEQETLPSRMGWRDGRLSSARCVLWQAKQASGCVSLESTLSLAACTVWQLAQATSRDWCVLPAQWERLLSLLWQDMQAALLSSAETFFLPGVFIGA